MRDGKGQRELDMKNTVFKLLSGNSDDKITILDLAEQTAHFDKYSLLGKEIRIMLDAY